jgi:cyclomaltodextrinase
MKILIILLTFILILSCHSTPIKDIVPFVKLEPGVTDTLFLDELFFTPHYHPVLRQAANLSVTLDLDSPALICTPEAGFSGMTFVRLENRDTAIDIPVIVAKKNEVRFLFQPPIKAQNVFVMGTFNSWNRTADPLYDTDRDGIFETTLLLDEGVYEYQFVYDKIEIWDKQNPDKIDNGFGGFNSLLRVTSSEKNAIPNLYFAPGQPFPTIRLAVAAGISSADDFKFYLLLDNRLIEEKIWSLNENILEIDLTPLNLKGRQCLRIAADCQGRVGNMIHIWLQDGRILPDNSFIWQDAIIYSLMIDRFSDGDRGNNRPVSHPQLDWY